MLADNITVKDRSNADATYNLVSQNGNETTRILSTSTKAEPETLRISTQDQGKGLSKRTSTLNQLKRRKSTTGGYADITANLTVNQPADGSFTTADILNLLTKLIGVISASYDAHATLDSTVVNRVFTLGEA